MKVYRHYRPSAVWAPVVLLSVVAVGSLAILGTVAASEPKNPIPPPVFALPLLIFGINIAILGRVAYEVRLEDMCLELIAPLRRVRIPIGDITRLAPSDLGHGGWFVLRHHSGRVLLDPRLDGMHELVAEIKRQNPAVELRGC